MKVKIYNTTRREVNIGIGRTRVIIPPKESVLVNRVLADRMQALQPQLEYTEVLEKKDEEKEETIIRPEKKEDVVKTKVPKEEPKVEKPKVETKGKKRGKKV